MMRSLVAILLSLLSLLSPLSMVAVPAAAMDMMGYPSNPTLTSPTISGTVAGGASYTSPTLTSPTISGTFTGTPTWASAQTFPGLTLTGNLAMGANAITFSEATLVRASANSTALRNGTTAQSFGVTGTYTDDTNFEIGNLSWSSNRFLMSTSASAPGVAREIGVSTAGGANNWYWSTAAATGYYPAGNNTQDLCGASNQCRNGYFGTTVAVGTTVIGVGTTFASLGTPADGRIVFCSDCDAPTLVNETCTSAGAKTGAIAMRLNSLWKCH